MSIIQYRIKNDHVARDQLALHHPIHQTYRQPNSAWAALKKHYGLDKKTLQSHGWKVKVHVDESELAVAAAEVAVEQAPMPGIVRRLLGGLFGKKG